MINNKLIAIMSIDDKSINHDDETNSFINDLKNSYQNFVMDKVSKFLSKLRKNIDDDFRNSNEFNRLKCEMKVYISKEIMKDELLTSIDNCYIGPQYGQNDHLFVAIKYCTKPSFNKITINNNGISGLIEKSIKDATNQRTHLNVSENPQEYFNQCMDNLISTDDIDYNFILKNI